MTTMSSLAARTRTAARRYPFLIMALRTGTANYTAVARFLDIDGEVDAVASALRRYADSLEEPAPRHSSVRVRMQSGIGPVESLEEALIVVGSTALGFPDTDGATTDEAGVDTPTYTALIATGTVDGRSLANAIAGLSLEEIDVVAAGFEGETMVVVVERLEGANAVRTVEDSLETVLE
ncbi:hypothetical protein ACLI4R_01430 [Natrialbaceae archaeon A-chndr2]